jgi:hypothetical protein
VRRLLLVLGAACSEDLSQRTDLSVAADLSAAPDLSGQDDLSMPDLAELDSSVPDLDRRPVLNVDLSWSSCAGTALAGTCAATFFDAFAACFHPTGNCTANMMGKPLVLTWDDSTFVAELASFLPSDSYASGGQQCLTTRHYQKDFGLPRTIEQFCLGADSSCGVVDVGGLPTPNGGALYDLDTGIFTCTDGTQVDVGAALGGCEVLNELLHPGHLCNGCFPGGVYHPGCG